MKKSINSDWLSISIRLKTDSFKNYLQHMETFLETEIRSLHERYSESTEGYSAELAQQTYEDEFLDDSYYLKTEFPNILRKSFIVSIYSYLEQQLFDICDYLQRHNNFDKKNKDISNGRKSIFFTEHYLKNIAEIDLNNTESQWEEILKINRIRNHITHEGKSICENILNPNNKNEKRVVETFEAYKYFRLLEEKPFLKNNQVEYYKIMLTSDFCYAILNKVIEYLRELQISLQGYIR